MTRVEVKYDERLCSFVVVRKLRRDTFEQLAICPNAETAEMICNAMLEARK